MNCNDDSSREFMDDRGDVVQERRQADKQRKKSHGNRKLQRYRRKLRKQGMDSQAIAELVSSCVDTNQSKMDAVTEQNEHTAKATAIETALPPSKPSKKTKRMTNKKQTNNEKQAAVKRKKLNSNKAVSTRKVKVPPVINDSIDYASVSDEIFAQMFSDAFNKTKELRCFLDEDEKLKLTRRYTSLIDRLSHVQLQEFQWKYYHHIGMTQNIWQGRMAKHLAEKYAFHHTYGRSKNIVEQRLKQIEHHMQQAHHAIQQFENEILSKYAQYGDCSSVIETLSSMVRRFVEQKQWSMRHEYEYEREMLTLDATDHQLVQKFFHAKPNKTHVISARRVWQATMKQMMLEEDVALMEHRLTSTKSQAPSNLVGRMIDDIDAILSNSSEMVEISTTTLSLTSEITRLQTLKKDILTQAIATSRGMIENLNTMIQEELKKYSLETRFLQSTAEWQKTVLNALDTRRLHMIERTNFIIRHKLTTSLHNENCLPQ